MATDIHERLEALAHALPSAIDTDLDAAGIVRSGTRRRRRVRTATVAAGFAVLAMGTLAVTQSYQPPGLQVVADSPESAFQPWQGQEIDVAIFLCDDARCPAITPQQQSDLHAQLEADPAIEAVYYESKEKALERFAEQFSDQPPLVDSVELDALSATFRIVLTETATFDAVTERYSEYPGVEEVVDHNR
jgi:cell division protein FtsX